MADDVERRLVAVEQGLSRLEKRLSDERASGERSKRMALIVRVALLVVVALAYYAYLKYVTNLT